MNEHFYLGLATELTAKLRRVSAFVQHGPSIGTYHEEALKTVLRSMLPDRFQLRTGFVYTKQHGASQQGDILLVDESHPGAYYFREGEFVIAAPEAVVCVIEVKTALTRRTFAESMTALHSFKRASAGRSPVTFLFAYVSPQFSQKNLASWYEAIRDIPDEIANYPWAIFALNQGIITLQGPKEGEWGHALVLGDVARGPKLKSLSLFMQTVRKTTLLYCDSKANPFEHAIVEGLRYADYLCRYGSTKATDA